MIIHMMNCLWKSLKGYGKILVVVLSVALALEFPYLGEKNVKAATVVHENIEGRDGDYTYSLWKDTGDTTMIVNGNGQFECEWKNINNALFREGIKFDCTKKYDEIGNITVEYGVDYQPDGNSYMCIYGWSRDPLIEYYIVDSWGTWRPPGSTSKGKIEVDGGTYDVYETIRENQPSIDGNTTFKQYWSVRTSKRTEGTISVTEHFKAWEKLGLNLGKLYEACLCIEGYQSNGKAKVYANKVTVGGEVTKGDKNSGDKNDGNKNSDNTGKSSNKTGIVIECESMTKSGPYAGNIGSPFSGVALYANDDMVTTNVDFASGLYDFTLRGASNGSNTAKVDLVVGNETKGTYSLKGTGTADYTIKNVKVGKGSKTVKLVVMTDDGTWDAYLDSLAIKDSSPARPKITAALTDDGKIKITIKKTDNASGYRIYVKKPGSSKYVKLKTISKNGKKVRTYTFEPTDEGTYSFKVKAYKKVDGKKVLGSASKSVKVTVE